MFNIVTEADSLLQGGLIIDLWCRSAVVAEIKLVYK